MSLFDATFENSSPNQATPLLSLITEAGCNWLELPLAVPEQFFRR